MCLVLGLKWVSVVASMIHALLSSKILDGGRFNVFTVSGDLLEHKSIKVCVWTSVKIQRKGRSSLVAVDKAIYSHSVIDRAISSCNLLHHVM